VQRGHVVSGARSRRGPSISGARSARCRSLLLTAQA
jgi:hypothetical protein